MTVGSCTEPVRAPRVHDKRVDEETGERKRISSKILPAYARRSPKVTEALPILYLHGLSPGDFGGALRDLHGEDASVFVDGINDACHRRVSNSPASSGWSGFVALLRLPRRRARQPACRVGLDVTTSGGRRRQRGRRCRAIGSRRERSLRPLHAARR